MLTMHSYNTRFQAKKAQTEFQERGVGTLASPQEFQAQKPQQERGVSRSHPSRRHKYNTRFEINRIRNAVIQRDCDIVSNMLAKVEAHQGTLDRVNACIDIFTYLRWNPMLFQVKIFADTVYKKMGELKIDCLNHIQGQGVASRNCHTLIALMRDISDFLGKSLQKYQ
jgi:hypothetical protein